MNESADRRRRQQQQNARIQHHCVKVFSHRNRTCTEENIKIAGRARARESQLYLCLCVCHCNAATKSVIVRTNSERQRRRLGGIAVVVERRFFSFFSSLWAQLSSGVFDSSRNSFLPSVFSQTKLLFPHFSVVVVFCFVYLAVWVNYSRPLSM